MTFAYTSPLCALYRALVHCINNNIIHTRTGVCSLCIANSICYIVYCKILYMCVDQQVLIMCVLIVLLRHENGKKGKQTFYIWKIKVNYTLEKKIYTYTIQKCSFCAVRYTTLSRSVYSIRILYIFSCFECIVKTITSF